MNPFTDFKLLLTDHQCVLFLPGPTFTALKQAGHGKEY